MEESFIKYLDLPQSFNVKITKRQPGYTLSISVDTEGIIIGFNISPSACVCRSTTLTMNSKIISAIKLKKDIYNEIFGYYARDKCTIYVEPSGSVTYGMRYGLEYNFRFEDPYFGNFRSGSVSLLYMRWYRAEIARTRALLVDAMQELALPIREEILNYLPMQTVWQENKYICDAPNPFR